MVAQLEDSFWTDLDLKYPSDQHSLDFSLALDGSNSSALFHANMLCLEIHSNYHVFQYSC